MKHLPMYKNFVTHLFSETATQIRVLYGNPFREKGFFAKMKETVLGKDNPWSGRFDLICDDGQIRKLDTSEDNSLYYAVVMATQPGLSSEEVKVKAGILRSDIRDEVLVF
ncbi:MAG: hypothetical protein AB2693_32250, partial [Candidatus Thiodiazotropha sp.]